MKKLLLIILFISLSFCYGQSTTAVKRGNWIVLPKQSVDTAYLRKKAEDMWNLGNAYLTWAIREDNDKRKVMLEENATKFYKLGDSLEVEYRKLVIELKYGK